MSQGFKDVADLNYAVQVGRVILRLIGAWPLSDHTSICERILTRLLNIICYFLYFVTLIPCILHIILKETKLLTIIKMTTPVVNCFACILKYTFLLYRAKDIRTCIEDMRDDWRNAVDRDNYEIMKSRAKIGRRLGIFSIIFVFGGGLSYRIIIPLSRGTIVTFNNVTVRPLPCPAYFVKFDEQLSPAYEIICIIQYFAGIALYSVSCGVTSIAAFFVMHTCGQLKILIKQLLNLNEGDDFCEENVGRKFADIVHQQNKVKRFLTQVEIIIQQMCLTEIVGCTTLICLCGYAAIMEWEDSDTTATFTYFILFVSFVFNIFVFCYTGQLLTDQGNEVATVSSTINWYYFPIKKARYMILIIAMSNYPAKITGGKMIEMSLVSFSNIIKVSMGYFNILRKTID